MFQVEVVDGGAEIFNMLSYREKHPNTLRYLRSQFETIGQTLTDAGKSFFAGCREVYDKANNSEAALRARLAMKKLGNVFEPDMVKSIFELNELQTAKPVMQRWIMAEPTVRQMYHDQRCDGFSDSFIDRFPGQVGENHYDYRRVMNGIVQDDQEHDWKATIYLDEIYEGDRELNLDEQVDILSTWDIVKAYLARGKDDPTSQYGDKL